MVLTSTVGAPTEGMAINIDGTLWHASNYEINQLGTFWVVKGTHEDGSVFSVMLPDPLVADTFNITQGGSVSIVYSTTREKGFTYFAPFSSDINGILKIVVENGYLIGNLEVALSNNAIQKKCVGTFSVPLKK